MTRNTRDRRLALFALSAALASAQSSPTPSTLATSPSKTSAPKSSITSASGSSTATYNDVPLSLWSDAVSLLSSYYPSTTLHNLKTVSWPATVVIDGSTYSVHPASTTKPAVSHKSKSVQVQVPSASATGTKADENLKGQKGDKRLGIILGVVIGAIAVAVMGVIFWCLHRRRKNTGSFFMRNRRTPSIVSRDSWRPGGRPGSPYGTTTLVSAGPSKWDERSANMSSVPHRKPPPMAMHPAIREHSSRSTSDDNPFYTPQEQLTTGYFKHPELDGQEIHKEAELDHIEPAGRRSSSSGRDDRPPTPFSPLMMMQTSGPNTQQQRYDSQRTNPFSSPEDDEAADVISPILPTRSPERRYSPVVHYPSWSEVSDFDFSGSGTSRSDEDGRDGWHPSRERKKEGRYELA